MTLFGSAYNGKRVLVTGHTGFKGAWLCEWLLGLGAEVAGLSLPPATPSLFAELGLERRLRHTLGDIRDPAVLRDAVTEAKPDFVFHLAAQALVRESYRRPFDTFNINAMGTLNLLEALRDVSKPCAAVFITTDKCYENREWHHGYRETDALGGRDPYSASKAAAELIIGSYRNSFFKDHPVRIASSRAGNVIGGGDWAVDRIIPDCIQALQRKKPILVRNRRATRPWQHVLEPLSGYLWLGACLTGAEFCPFNADGMASAFNFGPNRDANRTVEELVEEVLRHWPGRWQDKTDPKAPHEASLLQLSTDKAAAMLKWYPVWSFAQAVEQTVLWYRKAATSKNAGEIQKMTRRQISNYIEQARASSLAWVQPPVPK